MTDRRTPRRSWRAGVLLVGASLAGAVAWLVRGRRPAPRDGGPARAAPAAGSVTPRGPGAATVPEPAPSATPDPTEPAAAPAPPDQPHPAAAAAPRDEPQPATAPPDQPQPATAAAPAESPRTGSPSPGPEADRPAEPPSDRAPEGTASEEASGDASGATAPPAPARDDLTVVDGIGPKISAALADGGVATLADLAAADPARLREVLAERGLRLARGLDTWPAQARELLDGTG